MNCKFCGKELEDGKDVCESCAKYTVGEPAAEPPVEAEEAIPVQTPQRSLAQEDGEKAIPDQAPQSAPAQEAPAEPRQAQSEKKMAVQPFPVWKLTLACCIVLVLAAVLALAVYYGITDKLPFGIGQEETGSNIEPVTETLTPASELGLIFEGIVDIDNYTGSDEEAMANAQKVVATYGEYELTNGLLQAYYWMEMGNFVMQASQQGYDVAAMYGLDVSKPLSQQLVLTYDCTWQQYFLHEALYTWWKDAVINTMADGQDYQLSEEDMAALQTVVSSLEKDVESEGFSSVEELIDARLGAACDLQDYTDYMLLSARADMYQYHWLSEYEPSAEEVEEFFDLNTDYYASSGITKDSGKGVNVRHVLLQPEGYGGEEAVTEEQWEACRVQAQALLDEWAAGEATEESFGKLAMDHSKDGNAAAGGIYENVFRGQMVQTFNDWCFDESRKPGDYGLVKTDFGYHLMYFVSAGEEDVWYAQAEADCIAYGYGFNMEVTTLMQEKMLEPAYELICMGEVVQKVSEQTTEPTVAPTAAPTDAPTTAPAE